MKTILLLILLVSSRAFAEVKWDEAECAKAAVEVRGPATPPDKAGILAFTLAYAMNMDNMKSTLEVITGEKLLEDGIAIDDRKDLFAKRLVRDFLTDRLKALGFEVRYELVADKGVNVVAEIRGQKKPTEVVEVVTHYDSTGYNGADDNGSGVAFNLELARIAKIVEFDRTLRFVFTDLEEDERQGAKGHIQLNQGTAAKIVAAIVVDTIGWGDKKQPRQLAVVEVGTPSMFHGRGYKPQKDLAVEIAYLLARFPAPGTVDFSLETEDSEPGTADHGVYWKAGIPSVLIGEANEDGLINPGYHGREDNLKNINWDYYTSATRQSAGIIFALAGANYKPGNQATQDLANYVAGIEQLHVTPYANIPPSLDWEDYEPPRKSYSSSYSGGYGYSSYLSDLEKAKKAIAGMKDPKEFLVGLMPDPKDSSQARIFVIDREKSQRFDLIGVDRKKEGLPLLEKALESGITVVDVEDSKDQFMNTADTGRAFSHLYWTNLEELKKKIKFTVREPKPREPMSELPARVKEFMDSVGLSDYAGEKSLVIGVVDKTEGRQKLSPFFIVDPKLKQSISRRNLLSFKDVELMAKWFKEKNILIQFLLVDEGALLKTQDDLAVLANSFATHYSKSGSDLLEKELKFVNIDLDPKAEEK